MPKATVSTALGLPDLLADGGALRNLKGHAQRIADDIKAAAEETGGKPHRSMRYNDAMTVVEMIETIERVANGSHVHTLCADDL